MQERLTPEELHRRARAIFLKVRHVAHSRRSDLLDRTCGKDQALRSEVESLLEFDDDEPGPIDRPLLGEDFQLPREPEEFLEFDAKLASAPRPTHVGRYVVLEELGRGGMGVVYLAEQRLTRRRVALKLLRLRGHSRPQLRRFEREVQILGLLKHAGIAQVYEAGIADLGSGPQMFFAMELVDGPSITEFAERNELSTARRVALLEQVCQALHHAHGRGVLHRDLKPENILIDESGIAKVLDFGVARFERGEADEELARLESGELVGTPAYMSPEQRAGTTREIDARSDLYALGVLGHELLTGEIPDGADDVSKSLDADLAAILRCALASDARERYASAADLAEDLRRFLAHEPVGARQASTSYVLRKFAQRRRALAIALTCVFVLLCSGVIVSTSLAIEARRQASRKEMLYQFVREVITAPNPTAWGADVTVLEVLGEAEEIIRRQLSGEPEVEAEIRMMLGTVYRRLGDTRHAEPHLRNALELFRRGEGEGASNTSLARVELASLLVLYLQSFDEAELLLQDVLEHATSDTRASHRLRARSLSYMASIQRGRGEFDVAVSSYEQAEAIAAAPPLADRNMVLSLRSFRARALTEGERFDEAELLARATLDTERRELGPAHRQTLISMITLVSVLMSQFEKDGDSTRRLEAETWLRRALEGRIEVLGKRHPGTLAARHMLSGLLAERGELREALEHQEEVYAAYVQELGLARPDAEEALESLCSLLAQAGDEARADSLRLEFNDRQAAAKRED